MKPHNPDNLTPEVIGTAQGWRLLDEDECYDEPLVPNSEYWADNRWHDQDGLWFATRNATLRTRLTRAELRKARGMEEGQSRATHDAEEYCVAISEVRHEQPRNEGDAPCPSDSTLMKITSKTPFIAPDGTCATPSHTFVDVLLPTNSSLSVNVSRNKPASNPTQDTSDPSPGAEISDEAREAASHIRLRSAIRPGELESIIQSAITSYSAPLLAEIEQLNGSLLAARGMYEVADGEIEQLKKDRDEASTERIDAALTIARIGAERDALRTALRECVEALEKIEPPLRKYNARYHGAEHAQKNWEEGTAAYNKISSALTHAKPLLP